MCLVPLMHQILWLTSETSMKIALFSNFERHRTADMGPIPTTANYLLCT